MKRAFKVLLGSALLLMLLAVAITLAVVGGVADSLANPLTVQIDDFTWSTRTLSEHWLAASAVLLLALLVVLVIVPLAVAFGLLTAMLSVGGVALAVLLVLAMLLSPLWLLVVLAWWLLRKPRPAAPATIHT